MIEIAKEHKYTGLEIAVIGMAGRFPGARNIQEYWDNLKNAIESVIFLTEKELKNAGVTNEILNNPAFVRSSGAPLGEKEKTCFDASFFGYTSLEAELMDPQMRIFHECAWEALEDAGYIPGAYKGSIGLIAGASSHIYWEALAIASGKSEELGYFASSQLTNKDSINLKTSFKLDLKGPVYTMHTACSTSLAAIHLACQALLNGECDIALAGAVSLSMQSRFGYIYQEGMIHSSDGHCRAFDARANGTINGEGVGVVALKPLENAIVDRDNIYAIIKGTAINNDGMNKIGYTAPSITGQEAVIRMA
ncbi:MAG: hypothetical protein QG657_5658, partial [Acidobacteriota bacterium]|nr:hypothetical protein [Acidobacteriota bacterium]